MSDTTKQYEELTELALRSLDGELDAESHARLEAILATDPAARDKYAELMVTVSALDWRAGTQTHAAQAADRAVGSVILEGVIDRQRAAATELDKLDAQRLSNLARGDGPQWRLPQQDARPTARVFVIPKAVVWIGLAAVLGLAATIVFQLNQSPPATTPPQVVVEQAPPVTPNYPAAPAPVAQLTNSFNSGWQGQGPSPLGALLPGRYTLSRGWASIRTTRGVDLVLEAPATFEVGADNAVVLTRGQLVADVPQQAYGFTVQTPGGRVVDYGTTFGVSVNDAGTTLAHVFSGEIAVAPEGQDAGQAVRLFADEAAAFRHGREVRRADASPERFAREVPATAYQAAVMKSRPMCYWRGPIDETTRQLTDHGWLDTHGLASAELLNSREGFAANDPSGALDFGRRGGAAVSLTKHEAFALEHSFTIEAWCWVEPGHSGFMRIISTRAENGGVGFGVNGWERGSVDAPANVPVFTVFGQSDYVGSLALPEGRWTHLAVVVDARGGVSMFVNSVSVEVSQAPTTQQSQGRVSELALMIGRNPFTGQGIQAWQGRLDEIAIYDRALIQDEINEHYTALQSP